jgi:hypothetical protein
MVPMVQKKWNPWSNFHLLFEKKIQVLILKSNSILVLVMNNSISKVIINFWLTFDSKPFPPNFFLKKTYGFNFSSKTEFVLVLELDLVLNVEFKNKL